VAIRDSRTGNGHLTVGVLGEFASIGRLHGNLFY
jgi:hypothetical protein